MKRVLCLFFLSWGAGFCQEETILTTLLQKGAFLDAFQYTLQQDIYYTNLSRMLQASRIALTWGISTNGEDFTLSNQNGESRSYYFPISLVLEPLTNHAMTNAALWETLCRYYDRGLQELWFFSPEEASRRLLENMRWYISTTPRPDPALLASQIPALLVLGQTNTAWDTITNLVVRFPREPRVVYLYAYLLRLRKQSSEALSTIQQFYPSLTNPLDQALFLSLSGDLYLDSHHPGEAIFVLEKSLALSTNTSTLKSLLSAYSQRGDWQRFTQRALLLFSLNPENKNTLSFIARQFIVRKQREWSDVFFENALTAIGEKPFLQGLVYFYWGETYRNLSLPQQALWAYEKAKAAFSLVDPPPTENLLTIDLMIHRVQTER